MSINVLLEIEAAAGKADALKAAFSDILVATRAREGCAGLTVHQDQDSPNTILLIERWASRGAYETYLAWRAGEGATPQLADLVAGPPVIRYFDDVDA